MKNLTITDLCNALNVEILDAPADADVDVDAARQNLITVANNGGDVEMAAAHLRTVCANADTLDEYYAHLRDVRDRMITTINDTFASVLPTPAMNTTVRTTSTGTRVKNHRWVLTLNGNEVTGEHLMGVLNLPRPASSFSAPELIARKLNAPRDGNVHRFNLSDGRVITACFTNIN